MLVEGEKAGEPLGELDDELGVEVGGGQQLGRVLAEGLGLNPRQLS